MPTSTINGNIFKQISASSNSRTNSLSDINSVQQQQTVVTELSGLVTYMRAMGKFTSFIDCDCKLL